MIKEEAGNRIISLRDYSNLTSDLLVEDVLAMTEYISKRMGKEKVILIGHSYGTYIGMQAANKAPRKIRSVCWYRADG